MKIESKLALGNMLDKTMPGIKNLLKGGGANSKKDKLNDLSQQMVDNWQECYIIRCVEM